MGPAFEIFILLLFGVAVVAAGVLFFARPFLRRTAKNVIEADRTERQALEEQARERAEEAECRRRAEEELQRALKGEDVPAARVQRDTTRKKEEVDTRCEKPKEPQRQQLDQERH
jgi:flagellar biosynthesis/type III secretory pathway M-ring protein FliF/YscJ